MNVVLRPRQKRLACCVFRNVVFESPHTQHAVNENARRLRLSMSFLLAILLLMTITACGGNAGTEPVPPVIHYGEDVCEFCGMIISEERFAAGYITASGEEFIFDDIGDLMQARLQDQKDVKAMFVHDYDNHTWIRAETAYYAHSEDLPTPMLSGLAAFATLERAKDFAAEIHGQVQTFDELLTHYQENPPQSSNSGMAEN